MNGLIGFFDILGYQSFLKNNSATESALKVLEIITGVPDEVREKIAKTSKAMGEKKGKEKYLEVEKSLKHIVFSDTIVLTLSYPADPDEKWLRAALVVMTAYSGRLTARCSKMVCQSGELYTKEISSPKICVSLGKVLLRHIIYVNH